MNKIVVMGEPVPKGRPRVAIRGRFPVFYTPKETREAEDDFVKQAVKSGDSGFPTEGPVSINIRFYKKRPKSKPKGELYWTTKPDLDNFVKLSMDAMNKIFFKDDSQVVKIIASKEYDEVPRTEVDIIEL